MIQHKEQVRRCRVAGNRLFALNLAGACAVALAGCGGGGSPVGPTTGPIPGESTMVALQLSSDGNGQFIEFRMGIQSLTLTNKAGKSVTVLSNTASEDYTALNGGSAPLTVVSVPQDVYTSATAVVSNPGFYLTFVDNTSSLNFAVYSDTPNSLVAPVVQLAAPITVEGATMGLTLDLQTSQSGTLTGLPFPNEYSIQPVFKLTPFTIPAVATTPQTGRSVGLRGEVTAVSANSLTIYLAVASFPTGNTQPAPGATVSLATSSATVFQGVANASGLLVGSFVDVDVALQPDTSYTATRVEVQDAAAKDTYAGIISETDPSFSYINVAGTEAQGIDTEPYGVALGYAYVYDSTTAYKTSARFQNLNQLPFTAAFNAATLAAGQRVSVGSTALLETSPGYQLPTSITLIPQIIDGAVTGMSSAGNYTVYTVSLASYDPIPQLNNTYVAAVDTRLNNANTVNVYVNSSTSLLNAIALAPGNTFRFDGLMFNDAGTLRMVCDQVTDGVTQ